MAWHQEYGKYRSRTRAEEEAHPKKPAPRVEPLPVKLSPDRQRQAESVQVRIADFTAKYKLGRWAIRRALLRVVETTPRGTHGGHYLHLVERDGEAVLVSHENYRDMTYIDGWRGLGSFCSLHEARTWVCAAGLTDGE